MGDEGLDKNALSDVTVDMNDLELSNELVGAGQFGEVTKATLYGTPVCLKRMILSDDVDEDNKYIERELRVLQSIHHPNIMQFMGVCRQTEHTYMVTEYVEGGNMREILKSDKQLTWPVRVRMAFDVSSALAYLHKKHIIHRDLKSNNLLVDHQLRVKVCDFGFARTVNTNATTIAKQRKRAMTLCGTDEWMAPEVIKSEPYDEKADVFSFGIVLVEILTRKRPDENMKKRIPTLQYRVFPEEIKAISPPEAPEQMVQLACDCTEQDPHDRPDMVEVSRRLKLLLKQMLDEEEMKKASEQLQKNNAKAKSITRVQLFIRDVPIASVSVFACEDQTKTDFVKVVTDIINSRVENKVDPTTLVLVAPVQGSLIKLEDDVNPFDFFTDHIGIEKEFCFKLYGEDNYAATFSNNNANGTSSTKRRGSIFGKLGQKMTGTGDGK